MIRVNASSAADTYLYSSSGLSLSNETLKKLKDLNINIENVSSEAAAKRIIEEKAEETKQAKEAEQQQTDPELAKIYQRLYSLAARINVTVSKNDKVETILTTIGQKINMLKQNNDNANFSAISAEYDSIKYTYDSIAKGNAAILTCMDIMGGLNKALMGIRTRK